MSMFEYIAKFKELYKFSTINQRNPDEVWKCIKYEGGLKEEIFALVELLEIKDYATLINKRRLMDDITRNLLLHKLQRILLKRDKFSKTRDSMMPHTPRNNSNLEVIWVNSCRSKLWGVDAQSMDKSMEISPTGLDRKYASIVTNQDIWRENVRPRASNLLLGHNTKERSSHPRCWRSKPTQGPDRR